MKAVKILFMTRANGYSLWPKFHTAREVSSQSRAVKTGKRGRNMCNTNLIILSLYIDWSLSIDSKLESSALLTSTSNCQVNKNLDPLSKKIKTILYQTSRVPVA